MLGEVIGVEAGLVIGFDQPQAVLVMLAKSEFAAIQMIENTDVMPYEVAARRFSRICNSHCFKRETSDDELICRQDKS